MLHLNKTACKVICRVPQGPLRETLRKHNIHGISQQKTPPISSEAFFIQDDSNYNIRINTKMMMIIAPTER